MTLQERIDKANKFTQEIKSYNPEISEIWWTLDGCSVVELKEVSVSLKRDYDLTEQEKPRLRVNASDYAIGAVIFCYSVPVKAKKIIEYEEVQP